MTDEQEVQPKNVPRQPVKLPGTYITITVVIGVVALLVGGGIGYAIGKSTGSSFTSGDFSNMRGNGEGTGFGGRQGMNGVGGMRRMGGMGTVDSVSDSSITIKTMEGSTKTYKITSDTTVTDDGDKAKVSDIKTGDTVMVRTDSNDSDTAKSIRVGEMPQRADSAQQGTTAN